MIYQLKCVGNNIQLNLAIHKPLNYAIISRRNKCQIKRYKWPLTTFLKMAL